MLQWKVIKIKVFFVSFENNTPALLHWHGLKHLFLDHIRTREELNIE
jgi:hypothetical protein